MKRMIGRSFLIYLSMVAFQLHVSFASQTLASFCLVSQSSLEPIASETSMYTNDEERTFVAIKPDAVQRNLIGEILKRVEQKGLKVVALKMLRPSRDLVSKHYKEHENAYYFTDLVDFFLSGPIVTMVLEGCNAIDIVRKVVGKTQPEDADPGTIRGDYCFGKGRNLVHASDSISSAKREIELWFSSDELVHYSKTIDQWVKLQPPSIV